MTDKTTFDPSQFRLDTLTDPALAATPMLTTIPVKKPDRQQFIRAHPGEEFRYDTAILEYEEEKYLVAGNMLAELEDEYRPVRLVLAIARGGTTPFLWPLKLPQSDGQANTWNDSALMAAQTAKEHWVRVMTDRAQGMYLTRKAEFITEEPTWPEEPMEALLEIAFQGRMILNIEHPVVKRLRGSQ